MHETINLLSAASKSNLSSALQTVCVAQDGPNVLNLPGQFHNKCASQILTGLLLHSHKFDSGVTFQVFFGSVKAKMHF